jgi:hypothetical protein
VKWLVALITAVLQALLPWLHKQSKPTAEDADPAREDRDKLRKKVRKRWREA